MPSIFNSYSDYLVAERGSIISLICSKFKVSFGLAAFYITVTGLLMLRFQNLLSMRSDVSISD